MSAVYLVSFTVRTDDESVHINRFFFWGKQRNFDRNRKKKADPYNDAIKAFFRDRGRGWGRTDDRQGQGHESLKRGETEARLMKTETRT